MKRLQSETLPQNSTESASNSNNQLLSDDEEEAYSPNKKVKTTNPIINLLNDDDEEFENRFKFDKELFRVSLFTKPENDGKNETDLKNWNRCESKILNSLLEFDDFEDEEQEDEILIGEDEIPLENKFLMVSHIKDFDSHSYSNEDDDQTVQISQQNRNDENSPPSRVRFGMFIENLFNFDMKVSLTIDEMKLTTCVIKRNRKVFINHEVSGQKRIPLLIKRHELAFDEDEIDREAIAKLGMIKLECYRIEIVKEKWTDEVGESSFLPNLGKIKCSMVKDCGMSLELGPAQVLNPVVMVTGTEREKLCEYRIRYRNYTGYLLEIVRAGINLQQTSSQSVDSGVNSQQGERQIIELSDDESEESEIQTNPSETHSTIHQLAKITLPPPRIQSIMDKITEKTSDIEFKTNEQLIQYLKLKDEDLYNNVKDKFTQESIDGISFLLLNIEAMQPMKLRIGDQLKIKQIIRQLSDNSNL